MRCSDVRVSWYVCACMCLRWCVCVCGVCVCVCMHCIFFSSYGFGRIICNLSILLHWFWLSFPKFRIKGQKMFCFCCFSLWFFIFYIYIQIIYFILSIWLMAVILAQYYDKCKKKLVPSCRFRCFSNHLSFVNAHCIIELLSVSVRNKKLFHSSNTAKKTISSFHFRQNFRCKLLHQNFLFSELKKRLSSLFN